MDFWVELTENLEEYELLRRRYMSFNLAHHLLGKFIRIRKCHNVSYIYDIINIIDIITDL